MLSAATGGEVPPEPKAEPEAAKADEPAAPEAPAEPPPPPVYEPFVLPEGVNLEVEKLTGFTGLLGEYEQRIAADPKTAHVAFQELGQKLVDLYIAESRSAAEQLAVLQRENWDRTVDDWRSRFRQDPEIGGNRQDTSLKRMGGLMVMYGQHAGADRLQAVRDAFTLTGAGDHLEVLRFVNWMASRLVETPRIVTPTLPSTPVRNGSRAERLYKNTGVA